MRGLDPRIHVLTEGSKTWMAGTSPAMTTRCLLRQRRIKALRGLVKNPIAVVGAEHRQRILRELDEIRERAFRGRIVRAPGDAVGAERLHQLRKESLRRRLAVARLGEVALREL